MTLHLIQHVCCLSSRSYTRFKTKAKCHCVRLEDGWAREVRAANDVTEKSMIIATAAALTGAQVIIENPVGRSMSYPAAEKRFSSHVALWDIPIVQRWRERFGALSVDCAQCALGGDYQKLTTLLYTPGMHCALSSLAAAVCTHAGQKHGAVAHGVAHYGQNYRPQYGTTTILLGSFNRSKRNGFFHF